MRTLMNRDLLNGQFICACLVISRLDSTNSPPPASARKTIAAFHSLQSGHLFLVTGCFSGSAMIVSR